MNNFAIRVQQVTKKYNGLKAVDDVSFTVSKGDIFAFLGPNGAGKSTMIKMLTTLIKPSKGSIDLNGFNLQTDQNEVRKSFGIVFQDQSIDDELTAYENMDFHGILYNISDSDRRDKIKKLLQIVNLWNRKDSYVKTFSGGMKRRLEIARGLLHHPKIFFLDEPTLGLDTQTRFQLWKYIKDLNKNEKTTIFFTTHYLEEAEKIAKTIAIIDQGKIVAQGTLDELREKTGYKRLEKIYLHLTGADIREENVTSYSRMRMINNFSNRHR